jgi:hypothetical protein
MHSEIAERVVGKGNKQNTTPGFLLLSNLRNGGPGSGEKLLPDLLVAGFIDWLRISGSDAPHPGIGRKPDSERIATVLWQEQQKPRSASPATIGKI